MNEVNSLSAGFNYLQWLSTPIPSTAERQLYFKHYFLQKKTKTEDSGWHNGYLQDGEVLKHTVHHILFWKVLQFMNEVDHVFAHRWTMNAVYKSTILKPCVFCFHLLYHLFAKWAHFGGACDGHVLIALIPTTNTAPNYYFHSWWNSECSTLCSICAWQTLSALYFKP